MATGVEGTAAAERPRWGSSALRRAREASPATLFLVGAVLACAVVLLWWLSDLTFWRDEWAFLLHRRGASPDVLLDPHYEHIAILHVLVYKLLLAGFGMDSPLPFQVAATLTFLLSIVLVFVYLRRRVGEWLALAGVLPVLFLGSAWDDLLWPFQIAFFASMACGVGALLALEREDSRADLLACGLLVVSITFSSLGLPFAVAVALLIALDGDRWRRAFVVVVPLAIYGLWWLGWGHTADNYLSLHNLATSPSYVLDGFASSLSSLVGLATERDETAIVALDWGRPLLVGALLLAGLRLYRLGRVPRWVWVVVVLAISFWFFAGFNASLFREPSSGRYQYMGAIFILLIAGELLRGVRLGWRPLIAVFFVAGAAMISNLSYLHHFWDGLRPFGELQPAGLGALEIARDTVDPAFELTAENSDVDYLGELDAGSYLSAVDAHGSPAYTPQELVAASENSRAAADKVFAGALPVRLAAAGSVPEGGESPGVVDAAASRALDPGCVAVDGGDRGMSVLELPPGGVALEAGRDADAELGMRRYAAQAFPVAVGTLTAGEAATLVVPEDRSTQPWQLQVSSPVPVTVCGLP